MQEVWHEMLGLPRIGIDENFFDLGGDSLTGVTLVARLLERFRIQRLFMRRMFQVPTIRNMAAVVDWHITVEREAAKTGADP